MSLIDQINREIAEDDAERVLTKIATPGPYPGEVSRAFDYSEPCGCYACNEQVQPGHFACSVPDAAMLAAEARGEVFRQYTDVDAGGRRHDSSAWRWFRG